jgi:hypothetical protein
MIDDPADDPVYTPLAEPMFTTLGLLPIHEPPAVGLESVAVRPMQTEGGPEIAGGDGLTMIVVVAMQPVVIP